MENQAKDELKELKEAFENWKNTRPGKKGITPEELRNKVIKLLDNYSIREISKETKVHYKVVPFILHIALTFGTKLKTGAKSYLLFGRKLP